MSRVRLIDECICNETWLIRRLHPEGCPVHGKVKQESSNVTLEWESKIIEELCDECPFPEPICEYRARNEFCEWSTDFYLKALKREIKEAFNEMFTFVSWGEDKWAMVPIKLRDEVLNKRGIKDNE